MHRLIRRASMAFIGFGLMVSWFASFIGNILGVAYLAVVLILPYIFTKIYLKSYPTKKYSKFFIKNQRLCLVIFTVENLASIALILYPLVLIVAALIARNNKKTISLLLAVQTYYRLVLLFLRHAICLTEVRISQKIATKE